MSSAKLTLYGAYRWFTDNATITGDNRALFDYLTLPDSLDKERLIENILLTGGGFEVLYADPEFLRGAILPWMAKWRGTIEKWARALSVEYDPLNNYDRTEKETRTPDLTNTRTPDLTDTRTPDLTTRRTPNTVAEHTVSAYDSDGYQPRDKDTLTGTETESETGAERYARTGNEKTTETGTETWERRAYGNIGVTTSQQMLDAELTIAAWSIYERVTGIFLRDFTIPVYV